MSNDRADIYKSVKNRRWQKYPVDDSLLSYFQNQSDLHPIILEMLISRGVEADELNKYIDPKLRDYLPDPDHLLDMSKAANFIVDSICASKEFAVFGDYDVDGACASALLKNFFSLLGHEIEIYIPDRIREGYGPNIEALRKLKAQNIDVVITVDCGAVAYEALNEAKQIGLDVVVVDHHIGGEVLPEAVAVVNPNRVDEKSEYGYLCAGGVVFLLLISINKVLKARGLKHLQTQDLLSMLDLVALSTICDVVPLKGLNRAFVSQGIKVIEAGTNIGIKALKQIANLKDEIDAYHLGFILGPRINAGGRVGDANLGANLLSSTDFNQAIDIARQLDMHNHERKAIETSLIDEATKQVAREQRDKNFAYVVGSDWHLGVIGILAGRLKETFNKPSIVITVSDRLGKASCRSVKSINIGDIIHKAKENNLLVAGGGHAMAAGFTVESDKIDELSEFIESEIAKFGGDFLDKEIDNFDSELSATSITVDLYQEIQKIGPFGSDNPQPKFYLRNVDIINAKIIGGDHISCSVTDSNARTGKFVRAVSFRAISSPIGEVLLRNPKNINLIVQISLNKWNGNISAELNIQDIILN